MGLTSDIPGSFKPYGNPIYPVIGPAPPKLKMRGVRSSPSSFSACRTCPALVSHNPASLIILHSCFPALPPAKTHPGVSGTPYCPTRGCHQGFLWPWSQFSGLLGSCRASLPSRAIFESTVTCAPVTLFMAEGFPLPQFFWNLALEKFLNSQSLHKLSQKRTWTSGFWEIGQCEGDKPVGEGL